MIFAVGETVNYRGKQSKNHFKESFCFLKEYNKYNFPYNLNP